MKNESDRREFIRTVAAATAGAVVAGSSPVRVRAAGLGPSSETEVPDTLDLADRARVAINALTEILDPERRYMNYHRADYYEGTPYMSHVEGVSEQVCLLGDELWGKQLETLIKMRIMSGSEQNKERDALTLEGMVSCIGDDNLYWKQVGVIQGNTAVHASAQDNAPLYAQARVMLALLDQYQLDGNPRWLKLAERLGKGFKSVAALKQDYAYYPDSDMGGTLCMPRSGWKTQDEPAGWSLCEKGWHFSSTCVVFSQGGIVRAFCKLHPLTGDEEALDFAGKLVNFILKPRMWRPEADPKAVVSADHAHFEGHIHAYCYGLWGLLDYADLTNDARIKAFVRDGYEYIRNLGIARVGLFAEACTVGDMTNLAIRLSELGVGDYWDDVDQYVRNHLTEIQLLNPDPVKKIVRSRSAQRTGSWQTTDNVIERNVGALFADATHLTTAAPGGVYCCTQNGLIAYYHAWKSIVQFKDGVAWINLLLNRTSPWVDVESYLPYEGKVVLRNKAAKKLLVRIPGWVDKGAVKSRVDGVAPSSFWLGRYLVFDRVAPGQVLTIGFPVVESTEKYENGFQNVIAIPGHTEVTCMKARGELTRYTFRLRGNTVVEINPREEARGYPLYERSYMNSNKAPMKKRPVYVATKMI